MVTGPLMQNFTGVTRAEIVRVTGTKAMRIASVGALSTMERPDLSSPEITA